MVDLLLSRELRAHGIDTRAVESGARRGRFVRIRPGAYAAAADWAAATDEERHRARMDALVSTSTRAPVFSHESAALLHGIPVIDPWPEAPHTIGSDLGHRSPRGVSVHRPRHPWPFGEVGGLLATTPSCTALDLAASRSLAAGVVALDHVIAHGAPKDALEELIAGWRPFHGSRRVEKALAVSTGLSETPLESVSLVAIAVAGFPPPEQQVEVVARGRTYRLDFCWRDQGVVGEADGKRKYRTAADLWNEKQREDAIRSIGFRVARWGWDEALAERPVAVRLLEAGLRVGPRPAHRAARNS